MQHSTKQRKYSSTLRDQAGQIELAVVNDLAPTSLPTELLEQIFLFLVSGWHDTVYHQVDRYMCTVHVIAVSHVCHRWRAIALGYSALWTYISPFQIGYDWAKEILTRSKGAPLTLDIHRIVSQDDANLHLAREHLNHTCTLIVSGRTQAILGYPSCPAPLLESILFIDTTVPYRLHADRIPYHTIVRFKTSALRKLVLGSIVTLDGTDSTTIKDLSHLDIRNTTLRSISRGISVLHGSSSLKSLALEVTDFFTSAAFPIITLPALMSIRLGGTASGCFCLLMRIRAPSVKAFTLDCWSRKKIDLPILLAAVSALRTQNVAHIVEAHRKPQRLFISINEVVNFSQPIIIRLADVGSIPDIDAFCQKANKIDWNPNWHMDLHYMQEHGSITPNALASACKTLFFDSVTDLTVQGISGSQELPFYRQLLEQMPALRSLTVRHFGHSKSSASAIVKAIRPSKNLEMKQLSDLCFDRLHFKQSSKRSSGTHDITGLTKMFEKRDKMGLRLPSLTLIRCSSSPKEGLKSLKDNVIRMGVNCSM